MARGINKVILIGNLGNDPEMRYMPNGNAVTTISLATTDGWRDRESGERQERTEWHRVVFYNRLAEIAGEYLRKGSKIYAEGSLRTRKWQDRNGMDRYTTEIIATELQMLDSRGTTGAMPANNAAENNAPANSSFANNEAAESAPVTTEDFDDDVPF